MWMTVLTTEGYEEVHVAHYYSNIPDVTIYNISSCKPPIYQCMGDYMSNYRRQPILHQNTSVIYFKYKQRHQQLTLFSWFLPHSFPLIAEEKTTTDSFLSTSQHISRNRVGQHRKHIRKNNIQYYVRWIYVYGQFQSVSNSVQGKPLTSLQNKLRKYFFIWCLKL
jgi:hypothetical protein